MEPEFAESLHGDELDTVEDTQLAVEESVEVEVEPELDRDEAEANYQKALNERNAQLTKCLATQNKLADYFKRKKTDEEKKKPSDEETNDLEIKYFGLIKSVDVVNQELADQKADYKEKIDDLDDKKGSKLTSVTDEWESLLSRKREVVKKCVFARSGAKITSKEIDQMEELERRKNDELSKARLEFIKLKNKKEAREFELQQREQLGEGLHMIDYEQLKIENQTYNEKVEERNEDLLKFNAKINSTVQVLTHLKEKLFFVVNQNAEMGNELNKMEQKSNVTRDKLGKAKMARGRIQRDNTSLQGSMGLLGKMDLLYDFEDKIESTKDMAPHLEKLKAKYAALGKENKIIKKKMQKIKAENE